MCKNTSFYNIEICLENQNVEMGKIDLKNYKNRSVENEQQK